MNALKVTKADFGPIMWFVVPSFLILLGVSFLIYLPLGIWICQNYRGQLSRSTVVLLLFLIVQFTIGLQSHNNSRDTLNAVLELLNFALLIISPDLLGRTDKLPLRSIKLGYFGIVLFFLLVAALTLTDSASRSVRAAAQLSAAPFLFYISKGTWKNKALSLAVVVLASARSIALGWVAALVLKKANQKLAKLLLPTLGVLAFCMIFFMSDVLMELRDQGILLKGRTNFWINIVENAPILFFGNGPGYSIALTVDMLGFYQLPHNDFIRILYDFGFFGALVLVRFLFQQDARVNIFPVMFLFYCFTGNPLTFPSVIVGLVMSQKYS